MTVLNAKRNLSFEHTIETELIKPNKQYTYSKSRFNRLHDNWLHTWCQDDEFADYLSKYYPKLLKLVKP